MADRKNDPVKQAQARQRELIALKKAEQSGQPLATAETAPAVPLDGKQKWENFWYYYKFHVMAIVLAVVVLVVGVAQCVNRPRYDYQIVLFTYAGYVDDQLDLIAEQFEPFAEDCNGDGKVEIGIINCSFDQSMQSQQVATNSLVKLQSLIANRTDAMLFITDEETFAYLNKPYEGGMMANLGLPDDGGTSYHLPQSFYDATIVREISLPEGLRISRRKIEGTSFAGSEEAASNAALADQLLEQMIAATN